VHHSAEEISNGEMRNKFQGALPPHQTPEKNLCENTVSYFGGSHGCESSTALQ
jgi:hypothetical protein